MTNALLAQVASLPTLIREQTWILEDRVRKVVPMPIEHSIRQLIITGCGDSTIAGDATVGSFRALAKLPAVSEPAMEVARYHATVFDHEVPNTPFLIALSNSGQVARVLEAARQVKSRGGYVLGLTADAEGPLAALSDAVVDMSIPSFDAAPGMRTYVAACLALNLFAVRLAEVRGRITMDQAQVFRNRIAALGDDVERTIEVSADPLESLASEWSGLARFEFLGSGPSRASAAFASAKVLEASGHSSTDIDLEEFLHRQYFERTPTDIATVIVSPEGARTASRAREVGRYLDELGRPWVGFGASGGRCPAPITGVPEALSPVVAAAVAGLFAGQLMDASGETPGRGARDGWASSSDGTTTRVSEPWSLAVETEGAFL